MNAEEIRAKADAIVADFSQKRNHVGACCRAGICPKCGNDLRTVWVNYSDTLPDILHLRCSTPHPCGQWWGFWDVYSEEPVADKPSFWKSLFS